MHSKELKKLKERIFYSKVGGFDDSFIGYFDTSDLDVRNFQEFIRERKFSVGDTGVAYRAINHWEEKGLLPERKDDEGWRKFSFVELAWILVLKSLRTFKLDLEQISIAKQSILDFGSKDGVTTLFEYYLVKALVSDADAYIVVLPDSKADIGFASDIQMHLMDMTGDSLVVISLKKICRELGVVPYRYRPLFYLTESEAELIHKIRFGNYKSIEVYPKKGKVFQLDLTETVSLGVGSLVTELKKDNAFAEIITSIENGKQQSVKVRKKLRP